MRYWATLISLLVLTSFGWGQAQAAPVGCDKNVSFAVAENGQPVPDVPKFVLKWLGSSSRRDHYSSICFSQIPSATLTNYIVVFSTTPGAFEGLKPSAHTYRSAPQSHDGITPVSSYGGTWSYAYTGAAPQSNTDTLSLKRDDKPKSLEVRAFDQGGRQVSQYSLASVSSREKLLEKVLDNILTDSAPPTSRKQIASPLSVYYVNCDVDGAPVSPTLRNASLPSTPAPAPPSVTTSRVSAPPPPPPALDIWSNPTGADIFVDGAYVGKTPYSLELPEGEHTIDLRKKDFSIWQRRVQVTAGKRRVGGFLEQKVLNLE